MFVAVTAMLHSPVNVWESVGKMQPSLVGKQDWSVNDRDFLLATNQPNIRPGDRTDQIALDLWTPRTEGEAQKKKKSFNTNDMWWLKNMMGRDESNHFTRRSFSLHGALRRVALFLGKNRLTLRLTYKFHPHPNWPNGFIYYLFLMALVGLLVALAIGWRVFSDDRIGSNFGPTTFIVMAVKFIMNEASKYLFMTISPFADTQAPMRMKRAEEFNDSHFFGF